MDDVVLLSDFPQCACFHMRRASRAFSQFYDARLRPSGLRSTQYAMLRCIEAVPGATITSLGQTLGMEQSTATRNAELLVRLGLVVLRPDSDDSRKKIPALTEAGRVKLAEARPLWQEAQKEIGSILGEEKLDALMHTLAGATQALRGR